jgi:hypothetical protein
MTGNSGGASVATRRMAAFGALVRHSSLQVITSLGSRTVSPLLRQIPKNGRNLRDRPSDQLGRETAP